VTLYGFPRDPDADPTRGASTDDTAADGAPEAAGPAAEPTPSAAGVALTGASTTDRGALWRRLKTSVAAGGNRRRALIGGVAAAALVVTLTAGMVGGRLNRTATSWLNGSAPVGASSTPTAAADTVTLTGVGDVIMGSSPGDLPPNGGAGFFDRVAGLLTGDVVMGNLDEPISADTGRIKCAPAATGCHQFTLPAAYAQHLAEGGFDLMNLANNHTNDMGAAGLKNTRDALEAAGLRHTGAPGQITVMEVRGIRVAVLGFSIYSWGGNLNNIPAAVALVRQADAQADIVAIQMQGGAEGADKTRVPNGHEIFLGEDRGDLIKFTHAVIDAGADVVFGHGPHIMRGMEFYQGRLIAYSLGNFCGYGVLKSNGFLGVGGVLKVNLHKDGTWAGGVLLPTHMVDNGYPAPDPAKRALAFVDGLSRDNFDATAARVGNDGAITPPL
jgi:Bacterial capsule synthesis protein PGA_cap